MAKKIKSFSRSLDKQIQGAEPEFNGSASRIEIAKAFNWYNYSYTITETKKWILLWMQNDGYSVDDVSIVKSSNNSKITQTQASIARMLTNGLIEKKLELNLRNAINEAIENPYKETIKTKPTTKTIENKLIADLDDFLDCFYNNDYKETNDNLDEIISNHTVAVMKEASIYYEKIKQDVSSNDDGYTHINKTKKKRYLSLLDNMLNKLNIVTVVKKTRAPTKKKPKTVIQGKIADKLKYLDHHELGSSIQPTSIFGVKVLWTYNPTIRKLSKYVACKDALSIKGQTILNYDPEQSFTITIRKPEETVPKIIGDGIRTLNKYVSSLNVKRTTVIQRINDKTLLLRTQK